jgi:hypothetical protein
VGAAELAAPPKLPGESAEEFNGAAESAAILADLAIVINAWTVLPKRIRRKIVGMVRKATE